MNLDASFCMDAGQIKTGEDKGDTYLKMLQENVRVTVPVAYGIAAEYPNVVSLVKGFRCEGPLLLEDLKVGPSQADFCWDPREPGKLIECQKSANKNGALTDARIGPALSKRLYKIFMGLDPSSTDI